MPRLPEPERAQPSGERAARRAAPPVQQRPDESVLALQRAVGNRAVGRALQRKYEEERGDSPLPDAPIALTFDGETLAMTGPNGNRTWRGVSGAADQDGNFDYSAARQRIKDLGPIPEGEYWLDPRQLVNLQEKWFYEERFATGWGTHRLTIHPFSKTETFGRGGFFIHGGKTPGSIGCIDLTTEVGSFASSLTAAAPAGTKVRLHVHYATAYYRLGDNMRDIERRMEGPPGQRVYVSPGGHRVPEGA